MIKLPPDQSIVTFVQSFPQSIDDCPPPQRRVYLSGRNARGNLVYCENPKLATIMTVAEGFACVEEYRRTYGGNAALARFHVLGYVPEHESEVDQDLDTIR